MKYLSSNIKHLRKKKKLTQDELALKIGVKRSLIGSYEEGRAIPKLSLIQEMALYFDISFEDMLNLDLSNETTLNKILLGIISECYQLLLTKRIKN